MKTRFNGRFVYEDVYLGCDCSKDVVLTQQHQAKDCDINEIVRRYQKTGLITHVNERKPMYGDFSSVAEFRDVQNRICELSEQFALLPAELRAKFNHNPEELIEFLSDPANTKIAVELGILSEDEIKEVEIKSENVQDKSENSNGNETLPKADNVPVA